MSILVELKKKRDIDIVAHLLTKSVYANWSMLMMFSFFFLRLMKFCIIYKKRKIKTENKRAIPNVQISYTNRGD